MILSLILAFVSVVPAFFAWTALHELAHFALVYSMRRVTWVSFRLYPHRHPVIGWVWGSIEWDYDGPLFSPIEDAWISIAPRWLNIVAAIAAPFAALAPRPFDGIVVVMVGAGLVDFAVGSIGSGQFSDLQRASRGFGVSAWFLRVVGWSLVLGSGVATIVVIATR